MGDISMSLRFSAYNIFGIIILVLLFVGLLSPPRAEAQGVCVVGLRVGPGESCTYPGTDTVFRVDDSGRGRFLFVTAGTGIIDLGNTTFNGVTYWFRASKQADGSWLIEQAGSPTTTTATTAAPTTTTAVTITTTTAAAVGGELCDSSGVAQFSDVAGGSYGADYILCMRALGLSAGRADGGYGPDRELNRAGMASFMVRLWQDVLGRVCPDGDTPFTDVAAAGVHAVNIRCLYNLGITQGTSATTYGPWDPLRGHQISRFVARMLNLATPGTCDMSGQELQAAADCLVSLNIAPSVGEARSHTHVTRAQMAVYLVGSWHIVAGHGTPPTPPSRPTTTTTTTIITVAPTTTTTVAPAALTATEEWTPATAKDVIISSGKCLSEYDSRTNTTKVTWTGTITAVSDLSDVEIRVKRGGGFFPTNLHPGYSDYLLNEQVGSERMGSMQAGEARPVTLERTFTAIPPIGCHLLVLKRAATTTSTAPTTTTTVAPTTTTTTVASGKPTTTRVTRCESKYDSFGPGSWEVTIAGTVTAVRSVSGVKVEGKIGDNVFPAIGDPGYIDYLFNEQVDSETIGSMRAGEIREFVLERTFFDRPTGGCWIRTTWDE